MTAILAATILVVLNSEYLCEWILLIWPENIDGYYIQPA